MTETTQKERNTLRYYGERSESEQGKTLIKAANDADHLTRAEALLRSIYDEGMNTDKEVEIEQFLHGDSDD